MAAEPAMLRTKAPILILLALLLAGMSCQKSRLPSGKASESGMSQDQLNRIDALVKDAIRRREIPGAVVVVGRRGKVVYRRAFGSSQVVPQTLPMAEDMIFDLASMTKAVATAPSIMILAEQGRLSLTERVKDYVPDFEPYRDEAGKPGEDARLWHLLTHTSGLPPYLSSTDPAELEKMLGPSISTADLVAIIAKLKKSDPPGKAFHYSCLGYITLAHIIRRITGQTVAQFATENIFRPLRMEHTFFNPPAAFKEKCVPTQVLNGNPLRGVVHDPLARLQGGVSGNAGLFSTADDLAVFCQMILNKGTYEGKRILSPLAVERMTEVYPQAAFSGYGLGWDLDSNYSTNGGDLFGPHSFGHTGYTGTSMWIDPETDIFLIFLANRVHPDDKGSIVALRSRLANVVAAAVLKK
jgi:CubicO group peptidase (beta-lactamase class C family)